MTPINNHIKGDTWLGLSVILNMNGSPVDLTGATIKMHVKKNWKSPIAADAWSTEDETITITDAVAGKFIIEPKIVDIEVGVYYYDIEVTLASGRVMTIVQGTWEITYDVTR